MPRYKVLYTETGEPGQPGITHLEAPGSSRSRSLPCRAPHRPCSQSRAAQPPLASQPRGHAAAACPVQLPPQYWLLQLCWQLLGLCLVQLQPGLGHL